MGSKEILLASDLRNDLITKKKEMGAVEPPSAPSIPIFFSSHSLVRVLLPVFPHCF